MKYLPFYIPSYPFLLLISNLSLNLLLFSRYFSLKLFLSPYSSLFLFCYCFLYSSTFFLSFPLTLSSIHSFVLYCNFSSYLHLFWLFSNYLQWHLGRPLLYGSKEDPIRVWKAESTIVARSQKLIHKKTMKTKEKGRLLA